MISFDYITLKSFFEENKTFFAGARLQKIQQPTRRDFILTIRGKSETKRFYINIDPGVYHVCFISGDNAEKRYITIPKKPPMFCMLLRKHLEGFRITHVNVPPYERIFEIFFESYNELNEKINLCLAIELMGKYSNVILYNDSTKTIIGCAHNVGSEKSRDRELSGTRPYIYPPKQNKSDFLMYFGEVHYDCLNDDFMGISKSFQTLVSDNSVPAEKIKDYLEIKSPVHPAIDGDIYSIYAELLKNPVPKTSVNSMIDDYYSEIQSDIIKKALRLKLKNIVQPKYKKTKISLQKIENQLAKKDNAQKYKNYADLIMSNLYNNSDYQSNILVSDWNTNEKITIPLDKEMTLKENAARFYRLYTKSKNSKEKLINLKIELETSVQYLEQLLYTIANVPTIAGLFEILSECADAGLTNQNSKQPENRHKSDNIEKITINGFSVLIGKNNRQNDIIISQLSAPEDLWFHTQNTPGSHILLKISGNNIPDDKTIYECAKLAKKYSSASDNKKAGVIYTKRKYIKKPPKSNLGYVTYKNEKEIIVADK